MFYSKGCVKCKGDLVLEEDTYGAYRKCLQCGRITEVQSKAIGTVAVEMRRPEKIAA